MIARLKTNLLHVEDIYQQYGANLVLDNIDLSVQKGEVCSVVGPSGCGKSTLLRLILGQELPASGQVLVDGHPVGFANSERGIVFQKYSLFANMNVLQNVTLSHRLNYGPWQRWRHHKEYNAEAMHYLNKVRLADHAHKMPHELSGGMRQRVAVIRALIAKPRILLMDEPFGALDPGTREDAQMFLLELCKETGMTVFIVTHDLEEACYVGSRIIVVSQYYEDDRGDDSPQGSKIVWGAKLREIGEMPSIATKYTVEFGEMIKEIRRHGFEPEYRQHVTDFKLMHPHSFQTLTKAEYNGQE